MKGFIFEVCSWELKRFEKLCHVIWGTNMLFEKLTLETEGCIWKTHSAHNAVLLRSF